MLNMLETLVNLGPRPIGSPSNQAAADLIRDEFLAVGLEVEEQPYPCTAWEAEEAHFQVGGETLEAEANAFSLPCDVTAPLFCAGTMAELNACPPGRILLLYGDLIRAPLSPKSWFLKDERDDLVIRTLEALQPAAVVAPPTQTDYYGQLTEDWELDIPAATIPAEAARKLMREGGNPIRLKISAKRTDAQARNVVARRDGREETGRIVLCAHFDTKVNTPGASDNAAGAAVLLGLAKRLAKREFRFGLEFVAFNGEEYLPIGDDEYLRKAEAYLPEIRCAINLDGVGPALASTSVTALAMPEHLETALRKTTADFPGVVWVEPWYESNHSSFAMRGIPAVAVSAVGCRSLAHQRHDDAAQIAPAKLEECANLVEALLTELEAKLN